MTGFAAILFAIFDPTKPSLPAHRAPVAPAPPNPIGTGNDTALMIKNATSIVVARAGEILFDLHGRVEAEDGVFYSNSVVYIFR